MQPLALTHCLAGMLHADPEPNTIQSHRCVICCSQITLLKVHKMDEATKKPTTDLAVIDRFTTKLKKLAARQVTLMRWSLLLSRVRLIQQL